MLASRVDGGSVAFVRISFAAVMLFWVGLHLVLDKISYNYYEPAVLFSYTGFEWVQPWPGRGLHLHFVILLLACGGMLLGTFYRFASWVFAIGFAYVFLLDKTTYQNHYYMVTLMGFVMALCPAHSAYSFDSLRLNTDRKVPRWSLWLLRFQVGVVYFFGGVAKLNADWIHGFPMRQVLASKDSHWMIGPVCEEEWLVQIFIWGGILLDLFIVPALLWKRTRAVAFVFVVLFHLTNASLFRIGIFPWMMILLTTVYFPPDWPTRVFSSLGNRNTSSKVAPLPDSQSWSIWKQLAAAGIGLFVLVQLLLPLRHFCFNENTSWTERNHHFAWHMMLRGKLSAVRFHVIDKSTGRGGVYPIHDDLKLHQAIRMTRDPFLIRQFAQHVAEVSETNGFPNVEVRVFALCSMNGRAPQLLVNPTVDLSANELPEDWIVPLAAELGGSWKFPIEEWESEVMEDPVAKSYKQPPTNGR